MALQPPAPVSAAVGTGVVVSPPTVVHSEPTQAVSLMAPANDPTPRGSALPVRKKKKKKKKRTTGESGLAPGIKEVATGLAKDETASRSSKPTGVPVKMAPASRAQPAEPAGSSIPATKLHTRQGGGGTGGGVSFKDPSIKIVEPARPAPVGTTGGTLLRNALIRIATSLLTAISNGDDLTVVAIQAAAELTQLASQN